jgi:hypothetical protein
MNVATKPTLTARAGGPVQVRVIFLSDVHLGTRGCQADKLLDFLRDYDADLIFLVGDIVDGWQLKSGWYWPRLCENGSVSARRAERRQHSHRRTQMFLESIFRAPLRRPGASVGADLDAQVLGSGRQGLQQPGHADDRHHALDVVGEHIECHLS